MGLANTSTFNQVSFGQYGTVFTKASSDAIKPPEGMVFVAITILTDNTTFDSSGGLVSTDSSKWMNTEAAAHDEDSGSENQEYGSGGVQITSSDTFPAGITIFGRWSEIDVASGSISAIIGA